MSGSLALLAGRRRVDADPDAAALDPRSGWPSVSARRPRRLETDVRLDRFEVLAAFTQQGWRSSSFRR